MNIESAKYYKFEGINKTIDIVVDGQKISVPLNPALRHYQAILEWAKIDGNTIEDAD